ncbi:unnamed protein product [Rotaria sp. Silwood1]|nr:unnamed protein product [Rotaria sp. Silwood1]
MCDDLMRKLMKKLNMLIPEWELHRRINITIKQQIVSIIGLDLNQDYAYTLFSTTACPSGKISKADTVTFLRSINSGKGDQIEKQANEIHKAFDSNNDGVVDQREFLIGFALTSNGSIQEKLKYVFRMYDHDKNGVMSKKEIDRMVKIAVKAHANDDPKKKSHILDDFRRSLENLNQGKALDDIEITLEEFVQLLMENKELCEFISPFSIEQPQDVNVQQSRAQSK